LQAFLKEHALEDASDQLRDIITQIEREAYYAESCNATEFLRGLGRSALTRGETHTSKLLGTIAGALENIRQQRFPDLVKAIAPN